MERTNTERQNSERKTDWRVGSNYKDLLLILKRTGKEENSTKDSTYSSKSIIFHSWVQFYKLGTSVNWVGNTCESTLTNLNVRVRRDSTFTNLNVRIYFHKCDPVNK